MKKNATIVLSIIGAVAVIAAINPTMQAYAQNDVTATQSNSFTADISQNQQTGGDGEYEGESSQGFCLQVTTDELKETDCK